MLGKFELDELKVRRFVTSLEKGTAETVKGGESIACTNATGGCLVVLAVLCINPRGTTCL